MAVLYLLVAVEDRPGELRTTEREAMGDELGILCSLHSFHMAATRMQQ